MELKTYRAPTMHEALAMVRHELGPDAAVLHTREVQSRRFFGWLSGPREIEVTASRGVNVPSRLPGRSAYEEERGSGDDVVLRHDGPHPLPALAAAAGTAAPAGNSGPKILPRSGPGHSPQPRCRTS